jgi:adenosylcobinamide-GDP ribazoletransferase
MIKSIALAFGFLTILPVFGSRGREASPRELAASFSAFPLVGGALGLLLYVPAMLLSAWTPLPILAVLLTLAIALLTRFLHLDGLADLADGLWGGYTAERRLEIMKDSRTGSFGAAALSLILLLKAASLHALLTLHAWPVIFMAPVFSRYAMVLAAHRSPYARKEGGLGRSFLEHMTTADLLRAAAVAAGLSLPVAPLEAVLLMVTATAVAWAVQRLAIHMLGGVTGDVLGAVNEITEAVLLAAGATLAHHFA